MAWWVISRLSSTRLPTYLWWAVQDSKGQWTRVPNLKDYTFKGCSSQINAVCVMYVNSYICLLVKAQTTSRDGRIYGGGENGQVCVWKEPYNMMKLRRLASSNKSMVRLPFLFFFKL